MALESDYPELPANLSVREAISLYTACEIVGFDSPQVALLCSQKGVNHDEILAIKSWINQCDASNAFFECLALRQEHKHLQNLVKKRDIKLDDVNSVLEKQDRTIAEITKELDLTKKAFAILK